MAAWPADEQLASLVASAALASSAPASSGALASPASWKTFDPSTIDARAGFDGRYLVLSELMLRLDAKSSTGTPNPPACLGSFL